MTRTTRIVTLALAASGITSGFVALAGDLNPPVGPVGGTMKTLVEVEPRVAINATNTPGDADSLFKITLPGSYYLTGNITGVVGKHGIEISTSGVTLDLNGFGLLGVAGSLDGVSTTVASLTNIAVVNGSVRSWGGDGVDLVTSLAANCRVAEVLVGGNTANGIKAGTCCTVSNCTAYQNGGYGIGTGSGCTVSNCSAFQNSSNGITTGSGCTVSICSAFANAGSGFSTTSGCTVLNCSATFNLHGIQVSSNCTVAECSTQINTIDGIVCSNGCVVRGNACSQNGNGGDGAGIHATSNDNRIEGNNCTLADRGIDVDAAGNIIIRNTCSGNTINWDIAANNYYGPIIDRTGVATAAVNGAAAAGTLATTDFHANFSY